MTDACQHKSVPTLTTHSTNLHKTAGFRPVEGANVHEAFHSEHKPMMHETHKPMLHETHKPVPTHVTAHMGAVHPDHDEHVTTADHHEAMAAAHSTHTMTPHVTAALKDAHSKTVMTHDTKPSMSCDKVAPEEIEKTHPHVLHEKIKSASTAVSTMPDSTHHEHKKKIMEHLHDAHVGVNKVTAMKQEDDKNKKKVADAHEKVAKAEKDATDAHMKLKAVTEAHAQGKVNVKTVMAAHKDAAAKTEKAHSAAIEAVEASKEKDKSAADLEAEKHKVSASTEAAVKGAHVAAATTKGAHKPVADKVADHTQKTLKPMLPKPAVGGHHMVKTGCNFLSDAVLLTDLKPMHSVHTKETTCIGFGSYIEKGEQKLGAVKCKVDPHTHACPTHFEPSLCHITPMDVKKLEPYFKDIFS